MLTRMLSTITTPTFQLNSGYPTWHVVGDNDWSRQIIGDR